MGFLDIFFNDSFSVAENVVVWINTLGAAGALYVNVQAYRFGLPRFRKACFMVAGLSFVYVAAYLFLLFGDVGYLLWSSWLRGVAMVVWPVVWMAPAIISWKSWGKLLTEVAQYNRTPEDEI